MMMLSALRASGLTPVADHYGLRSPRAKLISPSDSDVDYNSNVNLGFSSHTSLLGLEDSRRAAISIVTKESNRVALRSTIATKAAE